MNVRVVVPMVLGVLATAAAHAQSLPTITSNMVFLSAVVSPASTGQVQQKGPLALTSISLANYGTKAASVTVEKVSFSNANCSGTVTGIGRYFYALVPPVQTLQLTYPTPLAFFPDQFGTVCLVIQNAGNGEVDASLVGYTQ